MNTDPEPIVCDRLVIVFAPGEGLCELGDHCPAEDLRWNDYPAYLDAHRSLEPNSPDDEDDDR